MSDLILVLVAGVEIIFSGSEMLLVFMEDTEIFGATLYGWFLGYLVVDTVINIFIPFDDEAEEIIIDNNMEIEDELS
jgi:hypothetical protein